MKATFTAATFVYISVGNKTGYRGIKGLMDRGIDE